VHNIDNGLLTKWGAVKLFNATKNIGFNHIWE